MEEWIANNYRKHVFVASPGHPVGLVIRELNYLHVLLLVPNGDVIRRPILWCDKQRPPLDPNVGLPRHTRVIVDSGRLQGMFGMVIGSIDGRVFVRTMDGCVPRYQQAVNEIEWKYFVEDATCLRVWLERTTPEEEYWDGSCDRQYSRGL
uniref:Uncharacterized protein n=1 Tax=Anopheles culicifacies TaxID=139723 RepID=A0A182MAQ9_9DIPT